MIRYIATISAVILVLGAVTSVILFRYQYVKSGGRTDRVDRLTGAICAMPCLPATPAPPGPPEGLQAQRAIAAVQARSDAQGLVLAHASDTERYEWAAVQGKSAAVDDSAVDASTYVVCYCQTSSIGFRWEVHLNSGEIFYMNDNANLSRTYGLTIPSPSPAPTVESADDTDTQSTSGTAEATSDQEKAVLSFYQAINSKDFQSAYALLSDDYKKGTSFADFVAGYRTTISVSANAATRNDDPQTIDVTLSAEDNKGGNVVSTSYVGYWVVKSDGQGGWLLDHGKFQH